MKRKNDRRGMILLMSLFFMVLISFIAFAYLELVPQDLRHALSDVTRNKAYYTAESSVQGLAAWLSSQEELGAVPTATLTAVSTGDSNWPTKYTINNAVIPGLVTNLFQSGTNATETELTTSMELYADTNTTLGLSPRTYKVHVDVTRSGLKKFSGDYVIQQDTFAKYGFFIQQDPGTGSAGYYDAGPDLSHYEGEFHINGHMPLYVQTNLFDNNRYTPADAPCKGKVTFTIPNTSPAMSAGGDGVYYQSSAKPFNSGVPATHKMVTNGTVTYDAYDLLLAGGRADLEQVANVDMPKTNSTTQLPTAKGAFFGRNDPSESLTSINGRIPNLDVTIPSGGFDITASSGAQAVPDGIYLPFKSSSTEPAGLYIKGNVREMNLGVASSISVPNSTTLSVTNATRSGGFINSGIPYIEIKAESAPTKSVRLIELRDASSTLTIPSGARVYNAASNSTVTTGQVVSSGKTVVYRQAGAPGNPSAVDQYDIYDGFSNGVVYADGNIGKNDYVSSRTQTASAISTGSDSFGLSGSPSRNSFSSRPAGESVGGLSGINYGAERTIMVNISQNKFIRINGQIQRGDCNPAATYPANKPGTSRRDGLGIVGYDVIIGGNCFNSVPMNLYALVMAGRLTTGGVATQGAVIYEDRANHGTNNVLNVFGSYVVTNDVLWASGGTGWEPNFFWDATLASAPPPFYPTLSSYKIQAYKEN